MKHFALSILLALAWGSSAVAQYVISGTGAFATLLAAPPGGAGQDFPQPVAGPTGASLDVSGPSGGGVTITWCVSATDTGYVPLSGKTMNVVRSGNGLGAGSILGGFPMGTPVPLNPGPVTLFCGEGSLSGIPIDYSLQGLSVLDPTFVATISFVVTPFP